MSILAELTEDRQLATLVDCPGCGELTGINCRPNHPSVGPCLGRLWKAREEYPEMPRGRKPAVSQAAVKLAEAFAFVNIVKDNGQPFSQHVNLSNKMAVTTDGCISAGYPIDEELNLCPHTVQLAQAINKCGNSLSITELPTGRLSIKGQKLNAIVPCVPAEDMPSVYPDPNIAPIDDRVKLALQTVGVVVAEAEGTVMESAVLLQAWTAVATDGKIILGFMHGLDLPPALVLPKVFITAIGKQKLKIVGFGFSETSVTFWYENGAWIKTQRYIDGYPDVNHLLGVEAIPQPIPADFFEACSIIAPFNENNIQCVDGAVWSHSSDEIGAQYPVPGLQGGKNFNYNYLKMIAPIAKAIDFTTLENRIVFQGDNMRGVLMCRVSTMPTDLNADIPF